MKSNVAHQASEQRYHHLFEHMPICILIADLAVIPPTFLEVNRRAELVYGYPDAGLIGMPVVRLVPEEIVPTILSIIDEVRHGQTVKAETTCQHRDGTGFSVRLIATPYPTNDDHMIVMVEDITAEKQRRTEAEAIEAERRRIAHEIHDGVAQNLAGLRFKSALWQRLSEGASPAFRSALDELQAVLTASIADIRRAIFALRPVDLDALGFFPALTQVVADFGDQNQLAARLDIIGPTNALPAIYELPLFRIIQEALNNIGQHANANSVLVDFTIDVSGDVAVSVRDNGRGFDPHQLAPVNRDGHFGLYQMRERILDLGGTLDIHSAVGQGTELRFTFPSITKENNHVAD